MSLWQALAVALATALLTWFGHTIVAVLQRQTEKDKALEAEKREAYKRLMRFLFGILKAAKQGGAEAALTPGLEADFFELIRDMTVYASDDVLRLFIQFKNNQETSNPSQVLGLLAQLLLSIRRDLGHTATNLQPKELLSTFVTDIDALQLEETPNLALQRTRPAAARPGQS